MRCNSACTTAVKRSSARSSPPLQAFNNTVTSADPPGSMAAPEKILTRLWPLSPPLIRLHRRRKKRNEALRCGGGDGGGNGRGGGCGAACRAGGGGRVGLGRGRGWSWVRGGDAPRPPTPKGGGRARGCR